MKNGIFYNSKKSQCSIYESGLMCYNALKQSNKYTLDYTEDWFIDNMYDFAIFNQHQCVNNWITQGVLKKFNGKKYCIVLEVGEKDDIMPYTPKIFDHYIVIDPTVEEKNNISAFPRPLEDFTNNYKESAIPIIGSFGFVTVDKRWDEIIHLTNELFDEAIIKINLPAGTHVPDSEKIAYQIISYLQSLPKKKNIHLELTTNYMEKNDLINWCAQNTINYFPYYRNLHGLAATTDQAISSGRPLLVTNNKTFRHILKYIKPYPEINLKDAISENYAGVLKMKDDWSIENFYKKFEKLEDL